MGLFWHCRECRKYIRLGVKCQCGREENEAGGYLVRVKIENLVIRRYFKDFEVAKAVDVELERRKELSKLARKLKGVDEGLARVLGVEEEEKGKWVKVKIFWAKYYQWLVLHKKPSTVMERLSRWKTVIKPYFGERFLSEITPSEVEKFQKWMLERGYSVCSVNRTLAMLRHIFSMAVKWGYLKEHPLKGKIEMLYEKRDRWTFITEEQYQRIRENLSETYLDLYDFLVFTGARLGEALTLTWKDILFDAGVAYLTDSKSNRPRVIYLSDYVLDLLIKRKQKSGIKTENERVFQHSDSEFRRAFKKALKESGFSENIRVHDLRHTFASWLAIKGTPIQHIQQLLGHSQLTTTLRYAHLLPSTLRKAVNILKVENPEKQGNLIYLSEYKKRKGAR